MLNLVDGQMTIVEIMHDGRMRRHVTWTDAPEVFEPLASGKESLVSHLVSQGAELIGIKHIELVESELQ